jgi:hypothetical protein
MLGPELVAGFSTSPHALPPSAHLEGFDINTDTCPAAQDLPDNVNLGIGNALEPFPEEHRSSYDLVHVRLMMYALRPMGSHGLQPQNAFEA